MEKYGFVYLWRDKKHNRYYLGCHWGTENDGHICSSSWMKESYKRRPNDFKRKIIAKVFSNHKDLLSEEFKWLSKIKDNELGKKYYNLKNHHYGHWSEDPIKKELVLKKVSASVVRREKLRISATGRKHTEETKEKIKAKLSGRKLPEEHKKKISDNHNRVYTQDFKDKISYYAKNRSIETRRKISENSRRLCLEGKTGMKGKKHSEETKAKMSASAKARCMSKD
jgi:hypothetical protein